ncbi:50S ribosomal protein L10 [Patescibacteria group bacterium]|nr:50S ribosomal protein L10 [Patescibacteria group bacterium]MBU4023076.1 50S ribosomal protein L10 [Patescibacteria group bacterium]
MALTKEQKNKKVEKLEQAIAKQKAMVFVNFSGLKIKDLEELREKLNQAGAKIIITKKTLASIAFKQQKLELGKDELGNELAIVFAFEDEIAPAKAVYEFSKINESLKIIGGYMENERTGAEEMICLAQLPSKQQLYAGLVGSLLAPISNFVNVQRQNIKGLFYAFNAIIEKNS